MTDLASILPDLSVPVVSILALTFITFRFLGVLNERADKHEAAMRELEASVRANLTDQLTKNTVALIDVAKVLGKVARQLDEDK